MIKFFRKIRQNMIKENNTGKYLKYAIGEIVLVVIGILIALAVAEWNSNRRDFKTEHRLLAELKQGITKDLLSIEDDLEWTKSSINNLNKLDSLLKLDVPIPSEQLNVLFGDVYGIKFLKLNKALYEDLKSVGFGIIQDEKLRTQIINVFENNYRDIANILESEKSTNKVIRPYYLNNFVSIQFSKYAKPKDIQALWKDSYYKNIVYYRLVTLESNHLGIYQSAINQIKILLELINKNNK
jgi:Family of unknown function (DUF6090)